VPSPGLEVLRIINEPDGGRWPTARRRARTRPSSSSTSAAARSTCRVSRSATAVRGQSTSGDSKLGGDTGQNDHRRWSSLQDTEGVDLSTDQDGHPDSRGRREGQIERLGPGDPDQPAVHHGHVAGPQAPRREADAGPVQRADRRPRRAGARAVRQAIADSGLSSPTSTTWSSSAVTRSRRSRTWSSPDRQEAHKGVNPDEVVAIRAAVQAGVLRVRSRTSCCST